MSPGEVICKYRGKYTSLKVHPFEYASQQVSIEGTLLAEYSGRLARSSSPGSISPLLHSKAVVTFPKRPARSTRSVSAQKVRSVLSGHASLPDARRTRGHARALHGMGVFPRTG